MIKGIKITMVWNIIPAR